MNRRTTIPALAALLLAASAAPAHATSTAFGERYYQVCGGTPYTGYSGFALCASVNVTVETVAPGQHVVNLAIHNMSGANGSYAGTVFTAVGLDNVFPPSIDLVAGTLKVLAPCIGNPSSTCDYSSKWKMDDDKVMGGGVRVDLMEYTKNGVNYSVASQCGMDAGLNPGGSSPIPLLITDCAASGPHIVRISFRVTDFFDPAATGDLFIKGQNGFQGQSTTCTTSNPNCVAIVPEPLTATLLLTGLGGIAGIGARRRRKRAA